jgi:hypothetical protein
LADEKADGSSGFVRSNRTLARLSCRDPYKANEARRHRIPRARYRVTNWPDYDRALQRRGSLTV